MRRFETPPAPPGWTGGGATLIRIVDPLGGAIAWLAPEYGGACVGYAIRHDEADGARWSQILRAGGPRDWRADSLSVGVAILGPADNDRTAASQARWRFIERDPTAATCATEIGDTTLLFTARLEGSALHLDLRAERIERAHPPTLGLRLTFADDLRRNDAGATGPSLHTTDGRLRITLATPGQGALRWMAQEDRGSAVEFLGASPVSLVVRSEE